MGRRVGKRKIRPSEFAALPQSFSTPGRGTGCEDIFRPDEHKQDPGTIIAAVAEGDLR